MRSRRTRLEGFTPVSPEMPQPQVPRGHGVWRVERAVAAFRRGERTAHEPAPNRIAHGEPPVSQAELQHVVREYRRLHEAHRRASPDGKTRRGLEIRLEQLRVRFERLLEEAAVSETERRRWRDELQHAAAATPAIPDVRPLLFRGRTESGTELELTANATGTVAARVDGMSVAVLDRANELAATTPGFTFVLDGRRFRETFGAPAAALTDLRRAVESGRRPRRRYARELTADGLIDRTLALTARGRRALALDLHPARHAEAGSTPAISVRGPVPAGARDHLEQALVHVSGIAPRPVLRLSGSLTRHEDPALLRPVVAKATIDVSGRVIRAHIAAASETEAINLLESRLHRILRGLTDREVAARREGRQPAPGEWRHGDLPSHA